MPRVDWESMSEDELNELCIDDSEDKDFSDWAADDACSAPEPWELMVPPEYRYRGE